jgi:hypothetical protein
LELAIWVWFRPISIAKPLVDVSSDSLPLYEVVQGSLFMSGRPRSAIFLSWSKAAFDAPLAADNIGKPRIPFDNFVLSSTDLFVCFVLV